jgi:putative transcriptional regulator
MHNFEEYSNEDYSNEDHGHDGYGNEDFGVLGFGNEPHDESHDESHDEGLKGYLLAMSPYFEDDLFEQAVVLIVQHDEEGAVGLVLNQPAGDDVSHLWEDVCQTLASQSIRFGIGGPLAGPVVALHTSRHMGEQTLADGIYLSAHANRLKKLSGQDRVPCRLVIGHTEWESGALEEEIRHGFWMPLRATEQNVFSDDEFLWHEIVQAVGNDVILSAPGVVEIGDPLLN